MMVEHPRYEVYSQRGDGEVAEFDEWGRACAAAVLGSRASETAYVIDVYAATRRAARRFGGAGAVRRFNELGDPSKVLERIEIRADSLGGGH